MNQVSGEGLHQIAHGCSRRSLHLVLRRERGDGRTRARVVCNRGRMHQPVPPLGCRQFDSSLGVAAWRCSPVYASASGG